jgi:hypothetical protein
MGRAYGAHGEVRGAYNILVGRRAAVNTVMSLRVP